MDWNSATSCSASSSCAREGCCFVRGGEMAHCVFSFSFNVSYRESRRGSRLVGQ